ncbi:MAG TPA: hypothetical protein VMR77_04350 [Patescibacteria group bacterium]|jgi:hypothetical protein|nr:hypothetical protein [Patescibacteria group bacterium]
MTRRRLEFSPEQPTGGPLPVDTDKGVLVDPQRAVVAKDSPVSVKILWKEAVKFLGLSYKAHEELGESDPLALYLLGAYGGLLDVMGVNRIFRETEQESLLEEARTRLRYAHAGHPIPDDKGYPNVNYYAGRMEAALFALGESVTIPTTEVPPVSKYLL